MKIDITTNKGIQSAEVLSENPKTWVVRLPDGNVVKRHKVKHKAEAKTKAKTKKGKTIAE